MKYETYMKIDAVARCKNPLCEEGSDKVTHIRLLTSENLADLIKGKDKCNCLCCGKPMSIELSADKFPELMALML